MNHNVKNVFLGGHHCFHCTVTIIRLLSIWVLNETKSIITWSNWYTLDYYWKSSLQSSLMIKFRCNRDHVKITLLNQLIQINKLKHAKMNYMCVNQLLYYKNIIQSLKWLFVVTLWAIFSTTVLYRILLRHY